MFMDVGTNGLGKILAAESQDVFLENILLVAALQLPELQAM